MLQQDIGELEVELKAALDEMWLRSADGLDEGTENTLGESTTPTTDGWAARMAEKEKSARVNPLDKVEKPEISPVTRDWRLPLYDMV